jgi:hypothetical protein
MKHDVFKPITRMFAIAAAFVATSLAGGSAAAQPLLWNPPCANATVINCTPCAANLPLVTNPAGAIGLMFLPTCVGGPLFIPTAPKPISILGATTAALGFVAMIKPGPVPPPIMAPCPGLFPPPGAADGWTPGVTLPPNGCCFDIYYYTSADPNYPCTILLYPGTAPCTP